MNISTISQPDQTQLGKEIDGLLNANIVYDRIAFVSAFVALRTILRLRERLLEQACTGENLCFTVGVDLGGTSQEVLEELLRWNCNSFVFHNPIVRATFHPKVYLFESISVATLFVGSNNLTDGGLYTNYEAATRYDFELPTDNAEYARLLAPLLPFIEPQGPTVQRLDTSLITTLVARGELPSEAEARQNRRDQARNQVRTDSKIPASPFIATPVSLPPLLPPSLRKQESKAPELIQPSLSEMAPTSVAPANRYLVWRKIMSKSDASDVSPGSHPKAQVVLSQAGFKNLQGKPINQTTYFRNLFRDFDWESEPGKHPDQEHTFIPFRVVIRGLDYGVHHLEISHKPSGEADQRNSPTSLRWGATFNPVVRDLRLAGATFSLYELADNDTAFLIEITDI